MTVKRFGRALSALFSLVLVLALLLPSTAAWADGTGSSQITGTVLDESGKPLPVTVTATTESGDQSYYAQTDATGAYTLAALPANTYKIIVDYDTNAGDKRITETTDVASGSSQTLNFDFSPTFDSNSGLFTGSVKGQSNQSFSGWTAELDRQESDYMRTDSWNTYLQTDGTFQIGHLPPGTYHLMVSGTNNSGNYENVTQTIVITAGQQTTGSYDVSGQTTSTLGAVSGTMTDESKQPITNTNLTISSADGNLSYSIPSDANGQYQLGGLAPGSYIITFYGVRTYTRIVDVTAAQVTVANLTFNDHYDAQTGAVHFSLLDGTAQPISGASVTIRSTAYSAQNGPLVSETDTSDANGNADFGDLPPGQYNVSFSSYTPDYQPSYSASKVITVTANSETMVDLSFAPGTDASLGTISGQLTDGQGHPISQVNVSISGADTNNQVSYAEPTDTNGSFVFGNLTPGAYHLNFYGQTADGTQISGSADVQVTAGTNAVVNDSYWPQASDSTGALKGQVTDANGAAVAHATVRLSQTSNDTVVSNRDVSIETDANGMYSFGSLAPGTYNVDANFSDANGSSVSLHQQAQIAVNQISTLDFSTAPSAEDGTIAGTVTDTSGAPLPNVDVAIRSLDSNNNTQLQLTTDSQGHFAANNLVPGTYGVSLNGSLSDGRYLNVSKTLTVVASQTTEADISFYAQASTDTGAVHGTVTDANGQPYANVGITLQSQDNSSSWQMQAAADGTYSIGDLQPGTYNLYASAKDDQDHILFTNQKQIMIEANVVATADFSDAQDPNLASLTGVLTGEDGSPLIDQELLLSTTDGTSAGDVRSDATGNYAFHNLEPGTYLLVLSTAQGMSQQKYITLATGQAGTLNFSVSSKQSAAYGAISGTLTDDNGQPLANADINLYQDHVNSFQGTTDANGHYSLGGVDQGSYQLEIHATNHNNLQVGYYKKVMTITANVMTTADVNFSNQLTATRGGVQGTVLDQNQAPAANVAISVANSDYSETWQTQTDANGNYVISGLNADTYHVDAGYSPQETNNALHFGRNATVTANQMATVDVSFGQSVSATLGAVVGTVTDGNNNGVAGATVHFNNADYSEYADLTTDASGAFQVGDLDPGTYTLTVNSSLPDGSNLSKQQTFTVTAGNVTSVTCSSTPDPNGGTITGVVKDSNGTPIANATVNAYDSATFQSLIDGIQTDAQGKYTISNVAPGTYTVGANVMLPGNVSTDVSQQVEVVDPTQPVEADFSLVLNPGSTAGTLTGSVTDDKGAGLAGAYVNITKTGIKTAAQSWGVQTDAGGKFSLRLNAGTYLVTYGTEARWFSKSVTVSTGTTTNVNFSLSNQPSQTNGTISGQVTDGKGNPLSNVGIDIYSPAGGGDTYGVMTDANGAYQIAIPTGTYQVDAYVNGMNVTQVTQVTAGQNVVDNFTLTQEASANFALIQGQVKDDQGTPLGGADVRVFSNQTSYSTQADSTGHYSIGGILPGNYTAEASLQSGTALHFVDQAVTLQAGSQSTNNFTFQLHPTNVGSIGGKITDSSGHAVPGAWVRVTTADQVIGQKADDNGNYLMTDLTPGTYNVYASDSSAGSVTQKGIVVAQNQQTTLNLTLSKNSGTVQAPSVNPVYSGDTKITGTADPNVTITVKAGDRVISSSTSSTSDAKGHFSVTIPSQPVGTVLTVYATDRSKNQSDPTTVTVLQAQTKTPDVSQITVSNNPGSQDTVTVTGLTPGDVVTVYDDKEQVLGQSVQVAKNAKQASVNVTLQKTGGTVSLTVTSLNKKESAPVAQTYGAEASAAPAATQVHVANNQGNQDTLTVSGLSNGDVVTVYDKNTQGQTLGTAQAAQAEDGSGFTATVNLSLPTAVAGNVYVTVTSQGLAESARTQVGYLAEPSKTPTQDEIVTTNNIGKQDTVQVNGLSLGDVVNVYAQSGDTKPLASSTAVSGKLTSATVRLTLPSVSSGTIYVAVKSKNLLESERVLVTYQAEPSAPLNVKQISVQNKIGDQDQVRVNGLADGDSIAVYDAASNGHQLGTGVASSNDQTGFTALANVNLPSATGGTVYVTVTRAGQPESTTLAVKYTGEQHVAPDVQNLSVTNNAGKSDTVGVKSGTPGDQVTVYGDATSTKSLGTATIGKDGTATVRVSLNPSGGTVYVTVKNKLQPESDRTPVLYNNEPTAALKTSQIAVTNNYGDADTVVVSGLKIGDVIRVYDAPVNGHLLNSATAVADVKPNTAKATVSLTLTQAAGTVYVTVQSGDLAESATTAAKYAAEPPAGPSVANITVMNKLGKSDSMTVNGLKPGDKIKVYNDQGKLIATSSAVAQNQTSVTFTLTLPTSTEGDVFVSVVSQNVESAKTQVDYPAEPSQSAVTGQKMGESEPLNV